MVEEGGREGRLISKIRETGISASEGATRPARPQRLSPTAAFGWAHRGNWRFVSRRCDGWTLLTDGQSVNPHYGRGGS